MSLVSFGSTNNALPTPVSLSKASAYYASMHYWQYPLAIFSQCITYSKNQRKKLFSVTESAFPGLLRNAKERVREFSVGGWPHLAAGPPCIVQPACTPLQPRLAPPSPLQLSTIWYIVGTTYAGFSKAQTTRQTNNTQIKQSNGRQVQPLSRALLPEKICLKYILHNLHFNLHASSFLWRAPRLA